MDALIWVMVAVIAINMIVIIAFIVATSDERWRKHPWLAAEDPEEGR